MGKLKALKEHYQIHGFKKTCKKVLYRLTKDMYAEDHSKRRFKETYGLIMALDTTSEQYKANFDLLNKWREKDVEIKTINWFLPRFNHVLYGGIFTIFRFADYFHKKGIQNRFIMYDDPFLSEEKIREAIKVGFPSLAENSKVIIYQNNLDEMPECDATISTFWTSAFFSMKFNKTKRKFYFIQDYEPLFSSANTTYAMTEMTYRFGFDGIINTPGLKDYLDQKHDMRTKSFIPSTDRSFYNIDEQRLLEKLKKDTVKIVTYGRPQHDRNAFELAMASLQKVKEKYGDRVEIVSVGAEWKEEDYGVQGIVKNLGRLNSIEAVSELYRECDIGLVFMFTPHPSYQPFEYMSCGCAVVTNYNPPTFWYLKDRINAQLVEPMPGLIAEGISELIDNPEYREKLVREGINELSKHNWDTQCESIYQFIQNPS